MTSKKKAQLLVEGQNDKHVVWALCQQYHIAETFSVETPSESNGGVEALLNSIPVRLKISGLQALGIMLDADQDLNGRWQAIIHRLIKAGYTTLPQKPAPDGTIIDASNKPKVGIWLMPNNQLPGMLETFISLLIPTDDSLAAKARIVLEEIEQQKLNRYPLVHNPKAFIHTWLAWQRTPGQHMGQAITAQLLNHNEPVAVSFVDWLKQLFE